ncbi:MAG: hypothetical protein M3M88_04325 [Thermoproteota archaeon]|nr:hypothetical protein [Thermoproteota archaeon]
MGKKKNTREKTHGQITIWEKQLKNFGSRFRGLYYLSILMQNYFPSTIDRVKDMEQGEK